MVDLQARLLQVAKAIQEVANDPNVAKYQRFAALKAKLETLASPVETAAVKSFDAYKWYTYKGEKAKRLTSQTTAGRVTVLKAGDKFGIRSGSKDSLRLVTLATGPSKVFTFSETTINNLLKVSKPTKMPKEAAGTKTAGTKQAAKELDSKDYDKILKDLMDTIKARFVKVPKPDWDLANHYISISRALEKLGDERVAADNPKLFQKRVTALRELLRGGYGRNPVRKKGNPQEVRNAETIIKNIPILIKKSRIVAHLSYNLFAAGEHLMLANALLSGDPRLIRKYGNLGGSGVREMLPKSVAKYMLSIHGNKYENW